MSVHQSDGSSFEMDDAGFYVPTCSCGWTFGPCPDIETVCDVLMGHAGEVVAEDADDSEADSHEDRCGCQYVSRAGVRTCALEKDHPGVHTDGVWKWHITQAPGPFMPMGEPTAGGEAT